ncbi:MAG: winged helix-turn-helix transcriptional regulator [Bacteroidia bacterium]
MKKQEGTAEKPSYPDVTIEQNRLTEEEKKFQLFFAKANVPATELCPVRDIMARLSDKWSMLVILALGGYGTLRFNEMKHKIGDVSQRMLTVTLRNLENDGLITRTIYAEVPPRVEYRLTPLGHSFKEQIAVLANWATANANEIYKRRQDVN